MRRKSALTKNYTDKEQMRKQSEKEQTSQAKKTRTKVQSNISQRQKMKEQQKTKGRKSGLSNNCNCSKDDSQIFDIGTFLQPLMLL
jgi:hypothetical protein